jgi:hypothetical protein
VENFPYELSQTRVRAAVLTVTLLITSIGPLVNHVTSAQSALLRIRNTR